MYKYIILGCAAAAGIGYLVYKLYCYRERIRELEKAQQDLAEKSRLLQSMQMEHLYPHTSYSEQERVTLSTSSRPHATQSVGQPTTPADQLDPYQPQLDETGGIMDSGAVNAVSNMIQQFARGTGLNKLFGQAEDQRNQEESLLETADARTAAADSAVRETSEEEVNHAVDYFLNNESETGVSATTPSGTSTGKGGRRRTPLRISLSSPAGGSPAPQQAAEPAAAPTLESTLISVESAVESAAESAGGKAEALEQVVLTQSALEKMLLPQLREVAKQFGIAQMTRDEQGKPRKKNKPELLHELSAYCNPHDELNMVA